MKLPFLQVEPSRLCNLRCPMCLRSFDEGRSGGPALLEQRLFDRILAQAGGVRAIHLQGQGEPLLHPGFFALVRSGARRGARVTTNTNLTLLDDRAAAEAVGSGLAGIYISVDGARRESYERIRRGASFAGLAANLRRLRHAKRRAASRFPVVHLVAVGMRQNLAELPALVRFAEREEIRSVHVQNLCYDFRGREDGGQPALRRYCRRESLLGVRRDSVEEAFERARSEAQRRGIELHLPKVSERRDGSAHRHHGCDWPWRGMYITAGGDVFPCCMADGKRYRIGSLRTERLGEIWNGPRYAELRTRMAANRPPAACRRCALYRGVF